MLTATNHLLVLGVALACAVPDAYPQERQSIDPTISNVDSAGVWEAGGQAGHYRAVTYRNCSPEHCYYSVTVEWLSDEPLRVVARKPVAEVGTMTVVTDVRFVLSNAGTRLQIRHEREGVGRWVRCLRLGAPGEYVADEKACEAG
jgi:hypothetical protein